MTVLENVSDFLFAGDIEEHYLVRYPSIANTTIVLYVVFVKWLGPWMMRDRKPFDLKYLMIAYNFMQCYFNAYIVYQFVLFNKKYWNERCMSKYKPVHSLALEEAKRTIWLVFLIKYIDLLDTVFFVLRKKNNQVTFLHIFHHAVMCVLCLWVIGSIANVGFYVGFGVTINTGVHVIMYFYYGLAAFGPEMRKHLWWKRYLTQLQITQFFVFMLYMLHGFVTGCEELGAMEISLFLYVLTICVLFVNFYQKDKQRQAQFASARSCKADDRTPNSSTST